MTDRPVDPTPPDVPEGEPSAAPSPEGAAEPQGFGDAAAEAGDESFDTAPAPTGAPVREEATADESADGSGDTEFDELAAMKGTLADLTNDLQRLSAEYANYRKRVERDRAAVSEQATGMVISSLLPILDDIDRAREHDDLVGPFATVAEQLTAALAKFGLTGFGEVGDAFDPTRHEAVAHQTSAEVTEPTCVTVMRRGYLLGDRLLRCKASAMQYPVGIGEEVILRRDGSLVDLLPRDERVTIVPFVGQQPTEMKQALGSARRRVEARERADSHSIGTGGRLHSRRVDLILYIHFENLVARAPGQNEGCEHCEGRGASQLRPVREGNHRYVHPRSRG